MAWAYAAAVLVLLPWIVYLALTLPKRDLDIHYRAAWVGFDALLVLAMLRTAYYAFRADSRVLFPATVTATLLIVDAWFDVTTSSGRQAVLFALALAIFVEIPSAAFTVHMSRVISHSVLTHVHHNDEVDGELVVQEEAGD